MSYIDIHAHTGPWAFKLDSSNKAIVKNMQKYDIVKSVFSSSTALMGSLVTGNKENYEFVKDNDGCYGYIVLNPNQYELSELEIEKYLKKEKIVGVKLHPALFNNSILSSEHRKLLKTIDEYSIPVLVHSEPGISAPHTIGKVAEEFTNTKFIIGHMGNTIWREAIDQAIKYPNVYLDTCTSFLEYDQIAKACTAVGSERVLFGTDSPLLNPAITIGAILGSEINDNDRKNIFGKSAEKIFDFK